MLVLTRKVRQRIMIGGLRGMPLVEIEVVRIRGDEVRLGIEAPTEVTVYRQEIFEAIARDRQLPPEQDTHDEPQRRGAAEEDEELEDF